jgi:hypothetical protein
MNEPTPENLAKAHLSKFGISKKTLLESSLFFPIDKDITNDFNTEGISTERKDREVTPSKSQKRGRPIKESIKISALFACMEHVNEFGNFPTNKFLTNRLEKNRLLVCKEFKAEIPVEFRTEVIETTVKMWTREFKKLKKERKKNWDEIFLRINTLLGKANK